MNVEVTLIKFANLNNIFVHFSTSMCKKCLSLSFFSLKLLQHREEAREKISHIRLIKLPCQ